jgi:hypothetical protein
LEVPIDDAPYETSYTSVDKEMEFAASKGAATIAWDILTHRGWQPPEHSAEYIGNANREWQALSETGVYSTARHPVGWVEEL